MSIVRVGLAETDKFAEGYEAIFGKKGAAEEKRPAAKGGAKKAKASAKKGKKAKKR